MTLRTAGFEPTFHKWAGEFCRGFQLHVTDRRTFKPYYTTLCLLAAIRELYPGQFAWRQPPYEYEPIRLPIDILTGTDRIRCGIEAGRSPKRLVRGWGRQRQAFLRRRRRYLRY